MVGVGKEEGVVLEGVVLGLRRMEKSRAAVLCEGSGDYISRKIVSTLHGWIGSLVRALEGLLFTSRNGLYQKED